MKTLRTLPAAGELWMLTDGARDVGLGLVVLTTEAYCAVVPVTEDPALAYASCALIPAAATPIGKELVVMAGMPSHHGPASFGRRIAAVATPEEARGLVRAADGDPGPEPVFPILATATADPEAVSDFTTGYAALAHASTSTTPALDRVARAAVNRLERELLGPGSGIRCGLRAARDLGIFGLASVASVTVDYLAGRRRKN